MTKENEIVKKMKQLIGKKLLESEVPRPRRIFILINKKVFTKTFRYLTKKMGFSHVSTITGVDVGKEIEVIYHLTKESLVLSIRTLVTKERPVLPSIVNLIPGSIFYEKEVHDLLGIIFEGNPDLSPLILPDGWPRDFHPLRKES